jgi:hypothetical protein
MLLDSFDKFGEVAEYDPDAGVLARAGGRVGDQAGPHTTLGHYATLGRDLVILARVNGLLRLQVGSTVLSIDQDTTARYRKYPIFHSVEIWQRGAKEYIIEFNYPAPDVVVPIENDPTPLVNEEDFDLGLFISNVINDRACQDWIYMGCEVRDCECRKETEP